MLADSFLEHIILTLYISLFLLTIVYSVYWYKQRELFMCIDHMIAIELHLTRIKMVKIKNLGLTKTVNLPDKNIENLRDVIS
jgi:hypothetical protein